MAKKTTASADNPTPLEHWFDRLSAYVSAHGALLQAELREKGDTLKVAVLGLLGGSLLLVAALVILLQALVAVLQAMGLSAGWASVAIGGGAFFIAALMIAAAVDRLTPEALMPERSFKQAKKDLSALREMAQ